MPNRFYPRTRSIPDHRDRYAAPALYGAPGLPAAHDFISLMGAVRDQGQQGSCTGFGVTNMRRAMRNRHVRDGIVKTAEEYSPAFTYYQERVREGSTGQDAGADPRDGMKVLRHEGVCLESDMPYEASVYTRPPSDDQLTAAAPHRITRYYRLATLDDLKIALAQDIPCGMALTVYPGWERVGADGVVPMPQQREGPLGGHFVALCGYSDATGLITAQNQYSISWGDKGYCYFPYAFISNPTYTTEMWAID